MPQSRMQAYGVVKIEYVLTDVAMTMVYSCRLLALASNCLRLRLSIHEADSKLLYLVLRTMEQGLKQLSLCDGPPRSQPS